MTAGAVRVGVLRHPARTDALAVRLRLGAVLASADLLPTGLAPAEVLCVRALRDPRPGTLQLDGGAGRSHGPWERAVAGALDEARRSAARPAAGAVPVGAAAVLFADEAELLACMGTDWLTGELAARWWWRSLLAGGPSGAAVHRAWVDRPQHAPAALELLARRGIAVAFAVRLEPAVADELVVRVAEVHGLAGATSQPTVATAPAAAREEPPALHDGRPSRGTRGPDRARPRLRPWLLSVPEVDDPAVPLSARRLLAVGLGLRRAPAEAARPGFLRDVGRWVDGAGVRAAASARPAPEPDVALPASPVPERRRGLVPPGAVADGAADPCSSQRHAAAPRRAEEVPAQPPPAQGGARAGEALEQPGADAARTASPVAPPRPPSARPAPPRSSARPSEPRSRPDDRRPLDGPAGQEVATELGGLFFLVDLALHLGLLSDFSAPAEHGVGMGPWDLVELLGLELLRTGQRTSRQGLPSELAADPVWPLLATLSVRPLGRPPAQDVDLPDAWQVPASWLDAWQRPPGEHTEWTWSAARGRLRVQHPADFLLVDAPGTAADLTARTAPYAHLRPRLRRTAVAPPGARGRPALRWARRLAQYVRPRLALAVGAASTERAVALVLRRPARILVTAARVDVVLALADHPLQIRVAGLDRDPGWLPAAGRTLAFTFR